jgi:hypothetical protein
MARFERAWRPLLAGAIVIHGWAHAVLALRGWVPGDFADSHAMPLLLYGIAMLGFVAGGVGLLGVRPFAAATRPLLVVASAYSLVALVSAQFADLWPAAVIDVALLIGGATGWVSPRSTDRPGLGHALRVGAALVLLAYTATAAWWPVYRGWGTRIDERALVLPGDTPGRNPAYEIQHAVTVQAPAAAVWPWLLQIGQDLGWRVLAVEDERALVLEHWGTFALVRDGETTRFIIRTPIGHPDVPAWAATLDMFTFQLPHFIMERRMMLRIKALAESAARS